MSASSPEKVEQLEASIELAAKLVLPRDEESAARLEEEIAVMRKLRHAHIVRYCGVARHAHETYILMEYVAGGSG